MYVAVSIQYNISIFNHINLSSPFAPLKREIDTCAQGLFHTKFNSERLLFDAFFMWCAFLASAFYMCIGTYITHAVLTAMMSLHVAPYKSGSPVLSIHLGIQVGFCNIEIGGSSTFCLYGLFSYKLEGTKSECKHKQSRKLKIRSSDSNFSISQYILSRIKLSSKFGWISTRDW